MALRRNKQTHVPVTHEIAGAAPVGVAIENAPISDGLKLKKMQT